MRSFYLITAFGLDGVSEKAHEKKPP